MIVLPAILSLLVVIGTVLHILIFGFAAPVMLFAKLLAVLFVFIAATVAAVKWIRNRP